MLLRFLTMLFSCPPHNISRVFTDPLTKRQYQICVECGQVFRPKVKF